MGPPSQMGPSSPIQIDPEPCPDAVIQWYKSWGGEETVGKKDLSLRAMQHLVYLKWIIWYENNNGQNQLRFTPPTRTEHYTSLLRACEECIMAGGCGMQKIGLIQRKKGEDYESLVLREQEPIKNIQLEAASAFQFRPESVAYDAGSEFSSISELLKNRVLEPGTRVFCRGGYGNKKGTLTSEGICCDCCGLKFSAERFEAHDGLQSPGSPSSTGLFLEGGRSLFHLSLEEGSQGSSERFVGERFDQMICWICGDSGGGKMVKCDRNGCLSSFHLRCLGLHTVISGVCWLCPACSCQLCHRPLYREKATYIKENTILSCLQCQKKFHFGCFKIRGFNTDLENYNWICSMSCRDVLFRLHKLLGKPIEVGADRLHWTLLKAFTSDEESSQMQRKLQAALCVLNKCFQATPMIKEVVFSRRLTNYGGFYTIVLQKNERVACVATVRIFAKKVAEVAFVATDPEFEGKGMCRSLMKELERQLTCLGIKNIILHSCKDKIDMWIKAFGFDRMTWKEKSKFVQYKFVEFADTIWCIKHLEIPLYPCID